MGASIMLDHGARQRHDELELLFARTPEHDPEDGTRVGLFVLAPRLPSLKQLTHG